MHSYFSPILLVLFFYGHQAHRFDTIVSFGDSMTDTGNVYNLTNRTWPIVPPYFQGRFSDGPVWIEHLGIAEIQDYAYGSATTDSNFIQGYTKLNTIPVPGVRQQIRIYLNATTTTERNFERTLYVIWAAGNDYFFNDTISPSLVVASILNAAKDLLQIGVKHLLIMNRSPVEIMPFVQTQEQVIRYREQVMYHNNNLSIALTNLTYNRQEVSIYLYDTYTLVSQIIANTSLNTNGSCWIILSDTLSKPCSNPEVFVYIDQYHFTARMHQLIGQAIQQYLARLSSELSHISYSIILILCALVFLI